MLNRLAVAAALLAALSASAGPTRKVTLDVKGMDCATCPLTVKAVLKKQPGVGDVKVDWKKGIAEVAFEPAKVSAERLAQAVTEAGFATSPRK